MCCYCDALNDQSCLDFFILLSEEEECDSLAVIQLLPDSIAFERMWKHNAIGAIMPDSTDAAACNRRFYIIISALIMGIFHFSRVFLSFPLLLSTLDMAGGYVECPVLPVLCTKQGSMNKSYREFWRMINNFGYYRMPDINNPPPTRDFQVKEHFLLASFICYTKNGNRCRWLFVVICVVFHIIHVL